MLTRRVAWLQSITMAWMMLECAGALYAAARAHSVALLAFGSEIPTVQDFTDNPDELAQGFRDLRPQPGKTARMIDAVTYSASLFADRPPNEHRVLFVIGESRDRGSRTKLQDAVKALQLEGVTVFPIVYSAYLTPFTTKAPDMPAPGDVDLLGGITEPARLLGKANAARELAKSSGGRNTSFATLDGLEKIITNLGEELHSEYLISYTNETCSPGYHQIEVKLTGRPGMTVRARPGYWTDRHSCRGSSR